MTVAPERIIVTAGSSAALLLVMALIVNRDERILLADPGYPCNRNFVRVLEGDPVGIPVGPESNYQLTAELIDRNWTPNDAWRADCLAVEPDRHRRAARRNAQDRRDGGGTRRPARRR